MYKAFKRDAQAQTMWSGGIELRVVDNQLCLLTHSCTSRLKISAMHERILNSSNWISEQSISQ